MRRNVLLTFLVVVLVGFGVIAADASRRSSDVVATNGAPPAGPAFKIARGATACQRPVRAPAAYRRLGFTVGTFGRPGQPISVRIRGVGGTQLSSAEVPGGYADNAGLAPRLSRTVAADTPTAVCFRNRGTRTVALYGAPGIADGASTATYRGVDTGSDLALRFLRDTPRSRLAEVPDMLRRASVFRAGWVGAWTSWVLAALAALAVPALLLVALRTAADDA